MIRRSILLSAVFGLVANVAGCDTISEMESWLPGHDAPSFEVVQDRSDLEVRFRGVALKGAKVSRSGSEVALQLDEKADVDEFAQLQRRAPDWIAGTYMAGNTANIVVRKVADLSAEPAADGFVLKIKPRANLVADFPRLRLNSLARGDAHDGMQREDLGYVFGLAGTLPPEALRGGSL